jgi:sugar/nucleoside kinase (ribokinase family)
VTDAALDLLVVGDCNPDVLVLGGDVTPAFGQQEKLVASISLVVGGSAAITAVAAARLGLRVALAAAIGDDPAGSFMLAQLSSAGVETSLVLIRPGMPTGMTVALARGGDRAILTATGAITTLTAADVPACFVQRARHLHVSSYFLLAETLGPGLPALFAAARAAGATTSIDTNWDPAGRWGDPNLHAALAQADLLLPNEEEVQRLSGRPTVAAAVAALTNAGPAVVVKQGPRGALCADGRQVRLVSPPEGPPGEFVDATGAGDCFNAGLVAGLCQGLDLPGAVALGCAVGAASTRGAGGTAAVPDLPTALRLAQTVRIEPAPGG